MGSDDIADDISDDEVLADLADLLAVPLLSAAEQDAVLDLTRVVAHGIERRFGPLAAYALGLAMSTRTDPEHRATRVRDAIERMQSREAP